MKRTTILMAAFLCLFGLTESPAQNTHKNMEQLNLTQEWDKTFPKSDKVEHSKVVFVNRFGVTLAADMYVPKEVVGKLSAVAVSGPFGAVKEQSSGLYAQALARTRFPYHRFRSVVHGGERRCAPQRGFARHQYGKISAQRSIFSPTKTVWIRNVSGSSVYAAGVVLPSTLPLTTRASRLPSHLLCTISAVVRPTDISTRRTTPTHVMRCAAGSMPSAPKIIGTVRMSVQEGWSIRFRPMRRSLYAIIMLITKLPEVITPVRSIPRRGGMRPPTSLF